MDLPSARELELETALRQRNAQVEGLKDEVTRLRQFMSSNPPAPTDVVTVPPPLMAALQPHIEGAAGSGAGASGSVNTALTQRVKILQEENDELYDLLKKSETGRLKEEVNSLSRVVTKLENALRESHKVILSLSTELDKTHETFARHNDLIREPKPSPRNNYPQRQSPTLTVTPIGKVPPTGPRSYKKPRVSDTQPKREDNRGKNSHHHHGSHTHRHHLSARSQRMDVDTDDKAKVDRERDDHDGDRSRKMSNGYPQPRNILAGGGGGGGGRRSNGSSSASGDRTLAERMGMRQ